MGNELLVFGNSALLSLLVVLVPMILVLLLFTIKKNLSENFTVYLYAFSSGLLIMLSTVGLIAESSSDLHEIFHNNPMFSSLNSTNESLIMVGLIGGGVLIGLVLATTIKICIFKKGNKNYKKSLHNHHDDQKCCVVNLDELVKKHGKFSSMMIISSHKFIDGISLGLLASASDGLFQFENIWIILLFIIHDLPITIIIFFTQKVNNVKKSKILLYVFILNIITVPFVFVGAFSGNALNDNSNLSLIIPFLEAFAGGILLFTTLMEIVPEFIHNHHLCSKHWYITVVWLCCGIILSLIFSLIHSH